MIHINNPQTKTQVIQRLSRIEGQLRGVQKMISEDRDCKEIVQQLVAIRAAIQSASLSFMQDVASEYLLSTENLNHLEAQQATMEEMIALLGKLSN